MKNVYVFILIIFCCLSAKNKIMAQVVASGTEGTCYWEITGTSGNYTLSIGPGTMPDYIGTTQSHFPPWIMNNNYRTNIKTVVIQQGVTNIGSNAFYTSVMTSITIPNSVTSIGVDAFSILQVKFV